MRQSTVPQAAEVRLYVGLARHQYLNDLWAGQGQDTFSSSMVPSIGMDDYKLNKWWYSFDDEVENLYLAFYRLVPCEPEHRDYQEHKAKYLRALEERWNNSGSWQEVAKEYHRRFYAHLKALNDDGWCVENDLVLSTEWRLIAGLGYKGALEVGITLHPLYGFPYLPGTSVKGVARAWAEQEAGASAGEMLAVFGSETKEEREAEKNQVGGVVFFDAIPLEFPELEVDIMTPHYGPYYSDPSIAPGDWHDPTPITFLTVAPGTKFRFGLAAPVRENRSRTEAQQLLDKAEEWLKAGLQNLGAGGKTSAGYGYFTDGATAFPKPKDEEEPSEPEFEPPPRRKNIGKNTTDIPAQIIDRQGRQLYVRLHAEGYEKEEIPMVGQFNPDGYDIGEWVEVEVEEFPKKKKRVTKVRYQRRLR